MTASSNDAIAVLRIELEYIEPLIWRRVAVRTSMNLKALHKVIQAAMGWLDYHLWEFTADERRYGTPIPDDPDWNKRISNAASTKLSALLTTGVTEFGYMYGGPYDPDDIDEQQIKITLGRIANSHRTGRSKTVKK
jgi:Plasmid pRiA4b ORF-3-like protein